MTVHEFAPGGRTGQGPEAGPAAKPDAQAPRERRTRAVGLDPLDHPFDFVADNHPFMSMEPMRRDRDFAARARLASDFRDAFRSHPSGVAIVTTSTDEGPVGVLVSSLASVSAVPAVVSLSLSDASNAGRAVLQGSDVVIHLVTARDLELAQHFALRNRGSDAEAVAWRTSPLGGPVLDTHGAVLFGSIGLRARAGAATLLTVELRDIVLPVDDQGDGLVHFDRHWNQVPRY